MNFRFSVHNKDSGNGSAQDDHHDFYNDLCCQGKREYPDSGQQYSSRKESPGTCTVYYSPIPGNDRCHSTRCG